MGLVIGITACCCAYCAIKKKRKQKRKRLANGEIVDEEENGLDENAEIPVDQSMIRVDDATEDEVNVDSPLQSDGKDVGMVEDPPPPYHAASVAKGTVLEELDEENIGGRKHSSKKVKYSHLSETAKIPDTTKEVAQEASKSDQNVVAEGDAFVKEVIDKMSEIEDEGAFEGDGKKQSSKRYKYSPLKGRTSNDRKRVKSGDSHKEQDEISWSNDVYIDAPPTEV